MIFVHSNLPFPCEPVSCKRSYRMMKPWCLFKLFDQQWLPGNLHKFWKDATFFHIDHVCCYFLYNFILLLFISLTPVKENFLFQRCKQFVPPAFMVLNFLLTLKCDYQYKYNTLREGTSVVLVILDHMISSIVAL